MDPSHAEEPLRPLAPPTGWPLCYRTEKEGIIEYNTFVNAWYSWASYDPGEDKDKWGEALRYVNIYSKKNRFCREVTQAAIEELNGGQRYGNSRSTGTAGMVPNVSCP
ncbi:hypothetical protein FDENT_5937 [Fusarium denticulatum]|uniref:Uncharacterized protein n=1 Tax=Fusarium denticulatum TaxID=48507 RepID=A0A8H5UE58_9HYPO|nr:hypothetical protein FDENT_5937 [Fusarium denticulatum]